MDESNPRLLFASYHAYFDHSSGAALSTRELFEDLTAHGWDCRVVCGPKLDFEDNRSPSHALSESRIPYHLERCALPHNFRYELLHFLLNGVPVTQYLPESFTPAKPLSKEEGVPFLDVLSRTCERFHPDVVLTYGGLPLAPYLINRVKKCGAKVVFTLHNMAYLESGMFRNVDAIRVPSQFAREAYRQRLGIIAEAVDYPRNLNRVLAEVIEPRFVTFINPIPSKGVAWFARIAAEMQRRRSEIPFLIVEGRGSVDWLSRLPIDLTSLTNLHGMHSTSDPRRFYSQSKMVLMPSLSEETFGRVAAEAFANGIPVLASRHGALPETLADAGYLFDIPERYLKNLKEVPTSEDVKAWVDTIEQLWCDPVVYAEQQNKALERARVWEPDRLRPAVESFFRRVANGQRTPT